MLHRPQETNGPGTSQLCHRPAVGLDEFTKTSHMVRLQNPRTRLFISRQVHPEPPTGKRQTLPEPRVPVSLGGAQFLLKQPEQALVLAGSTRHRCRESTCGKDRSRLRWLNVQRGGADPVWQHFSLRCHSTLGSSDYFLAVMELKV